MKHPASRPCRWNWFSTPQDLCIWLFDITSVNTCSIPRTPSTPQFIVISFSVGFVAVWGANQTIERLWRDERAISWTWNPWHSNKWLQTYYRHYSIFLEHARRQDVCWVFGDAALVSLNSKVDWVGLPENGCEVGLKDIPFQPWLIPL